MELGAAASWVHEAQGKYNFRKMTSCGLLVSTELGLGLPISDAKTGLWQNVPQAIYVFMH